MSVGDVAAAVAIAVAFQLWFLAICLAPNDQIPEQIASQANAASQRGEKTKGEQPDSPWPITQNYSRHREDKEHRRHEKRYWVASLLIALIAEFGALVAAGGAYLAYGEAKRQTEVLQNQERRQLRVYLYATVKPYATSSSDNPIVLIQAMGQSPAYKVTGWAATEWKPFPLPAGDMEDAPWDQEEVFKTINHSVGILAPPAGPLSWVAPPDTRLSQADRDFIKDIPGYRLYVIAEVYYSDIFKRRHRLRYCASFEPPKPGNGGLSEGEICPYYNDADEDSGE